MCDYIYSSRGGDVTPVRAVVVHDLHETHDHQPQYIRRGQPVSPSRRRMNKISAGVIITDRLCVYKTFWLTEYITYITPERPNVRDVYASRAAATTAKAVAESKTRT